MEEVCRRFPLLADRLLSGLDYQSLVKCKEVSKKMNEFLNTGKFLWKQMIIKRITGNLYFHLYVHYFHERSNQIQSLPQSQSKKILEDLKNCGYGTSVH